MPVEYFWAWCPNCMKKSRFELQYVIPEGVAVYKCAVCGLEVTA